MSKKVPIDIQKIANQKPQSRFADQLIPAAERIYNEVVTAVKDGSLDSIEALGRISLAVLVDDIAEGRWEGKEALSFLRTLAEKKTPPPVQRIEQREQIDMRVIMASAVGSNVAALDLALEKAKAAQNEIKERLTGLDINSLGLGESDPGKMELPPAPAELDLVND